MPHAEDIKIKESLQPDWQGWRGLLPEHSRGVFIRWSVNHYVCLLARDLLIGMYLFIPSLDTYFLILLLDVCLLGP